MDLIVNLKNFTENYIPDRSERQHSLVCTLNMKLTELQAVLVGLEAILAKEFNTTFSSYLLDFDWRVKNILYFLRTIETTTPCFRSLATIAEIFPLKSIDSNFILRLEEKIDHLKRNLDKLEIHFEIIMEPYEEELVLEFAFRTEYLSHFIKSGPLVKSEKTKKGLPPKPEAGGFVALFKESIRTIERPVYYPIPVENEQHGNKLMNQKIKEIEPSGISWIEDTIYKSRTEILSLLKKKREELKTEFLEIYKNSFEGITKGKEAQNEFKKLNQLDMNAEGLDAANERVRCALALWNYAAKTKEESHKNVINRLNLLKKKIDHELHQKGTRVDPFEILREEGLKIDWISIGESCLIQKQQNEQSRWELFGEILLFLIFIEFGFKQLGESSNYYPKNPSAAQTVLESQSIDSAQYLKESEAFELRQSLEEEAVNDKSQTATAYEALNFRKLSDDLYVKIFHKNNKAHVVFKRKNTEVGKKGTRIQFTNLLTFPIDIHDQEDKSRERSVVISQGDSQTTGSLFLLFSSDSKDFLYRIDLPTLQRRPLPIDLNEFISYRLINLLPLRSAVDKWDPRLLKFLSVEAQGVLRLSLGKSSGNCVEPLLIVGLDFEGHWLRLFPNRYAWIQQCEDQVSVSLIQTKDKGMQVAVVNRLSQSLFELRIVDSMGKSKALQVPILASNESPSTAVESLKVFNAFSPSSDQLTVLAILRSADQKKRLIRVLFLGNGQTKHCDFDVSAQLVELKEIAPKQLALKNFVALGKDGTQKQLLMLGVSEFSMMICL